MYIFGLWGLTYFSNKQINLSMKKNILVGNGANKETVKIKSSKNLNLSKSAVKKKAQSNTVQIIEGGKLGSSGIDLNLEFARRVSALHRDLDNNLRYIKSKILVQRSISVGFLIAQEEVRRGEVFEKFWLGVSNYLASLGCTYKTRSVLFESKRLYSVFKRFVTIIDGKVSVENVRIPLGISKKHLLLIASFCNSEDQEDIFIEKVIRQSLNCSNLRAQLELGVKSKGSGVLLDIDGLAIKKGYDLTSLGIDKGLSENAIKAEIIKNISTFIQVVLGPNWAFIPEKKIFIGGVTKSLDLFFYNVITHRYLIIDLKSSYLVSELDRAKSQMASYITAQDQAINNTFQKKTIGLILGKEPIDSVYFNSTDTPENMFYSGFTL
jgi:predicted nuclease of restriction endonuclease-like (RecB) superfamily